MIRTQMEYRQAQRRIAQEKQRLAKYRSHLREQGLTPAQVDKALEPIRSFHLQLVEEAAAYKRLARGQFGSLHNFEGLGQLLVSLRIARGITQRELARRLGVDESQVSRDEHNEYHNIGIDRASKILAALGACLQTRVRSGPARGRAQNAA